MSDSYDRGRDFERKVRNVTRRILRIDIERDPSSGAKLHKQDIRDRYHQLPIFIECKDQKTVKPKEWWRRAAGVASSGEAPVVVFPDSEEILCVIRYSDLLQFIKAGWDWQKTAEDFRYRPAPSDKVVVGVDFAVGPDQTIGDGGMCPNGHLADTNGYCMDRGCRYSRGFRQPKKKQGVR